MNRKLYFSFPSTCILYLCVLLFPGKKLQSVLNRNGEINNLCFVPDFWRKESGLSLISILLAVNFYRFSLSDCGGFHLVFCEFLLGMEVEFFQKIFLCL